MLISTKAAKEATKIAEMMRAGIIIFVQISNPYAKEGRYVSKNRGRVRVVVWR